MRERSRNNVALLKALLTIMYVRKKWVNVNACHNNVVTDTTCFMVRLGKKKCQKVSSGWWARKIAKNDETWKNYINEYPWREVWGEKGDFVFFGSWVKPSWIFHSCKNQNVIPKSPWFTVANRALKRSLAYYECQRKLLNEEINQKQSFIRSLTNK